jgi:hypothetical protein
MIGGRPYLFAICERVGGIFAYSIDDPSAPVFEGYINSRNFTFATNLPSSGDLGPEGIVFVSESDSPTGKALLLVAHEISGTLAIYEVARVCDTPGDINADCAVDAADLGELLSQWGPCGKGGCSADLDLNGDVGASDLATLLSNWG